MYQICCLSFSVPLGHFLYHLVILCVTWSLYVSRGHFMCHFVILCHLAILRVIWSFCVTWSFYVPLGHFVSLLCATWPLYVSLGHFMCHLVILCVMVILYHLVILVSLGHFVSLVHFMCHLFILCVTCSFYVLLGQPFQILLFWLISLTFVQFSCDWQHLFMKIWVWEYGTRLRDVKCWMTVHSYNWWVWV